MTPSEFCLENRITGMGKVEKLKYVNSISENQPVSLLCPTKKKRKKREGKGKRSKASSFELEVICIEEKKDLNFHSELAI